MVNISNKSIVALLAVALVVTLVGTVVSISRLNSLGGQYGLLNAAAGTSLTEKDGTASITVSGTAAIVMNSSSINLYAGYYPTSCSTGYSKIDTSLDETGAPTTTSCWVNTSGVDNQTRNKAAHMIANNGTTVIQVTSYVTSSSTTGVSTLNATSILCGAGNCPAGAANAIVSIQAWNHESNSCTQGLASSKTALILPTSLQNVTLCSRLEYDDSNDEINTTFVIQIPKDTDQGAKQFTVTYYATAQ